MTDSPPPRPPIAHRTPAETEHLIEMARAILPTHTASRLARVGGVQSRVGQRWISGEVPMPTDVVEWLRQQAQALAGSELAAGIEREIAAARDAGVHDEVIAARIAALYASVFGRSMD